MTTKFDFLNRDHVARAAADAANAVLAVVMTGFQTGAWPQAYVDLHDRLVRVRQLSNAAAQEEEDK